MLRYQGAAAASSSGVVIGRVQILASGEIPVEERHLLPDAVADEQLRLDTAVAESLQDLQLESQQVHASGHHEVAAILETHRLILQDPEFIGRVRQCIKNECINAEWAMRKHLMGVKKLFTAMQEQYFRDRFQDIWHIGQRVLQKLAPKNDGISLAVINTSVEPTVFVTDNISPAHVVMLWRMKAAGLIVDQGGINAHAMIIARGVGLPMLVGSKDLLGKTDDGDHIILDAERCCYVLHPNQSDLSDSALFRSALAVIRDDLQCFSNRRSLSKNNHPLLLMANVEFEEEISAVEAVGADGIGLFRTEFIYLRKGTPPDEDEQYAQYSKIIDLMQGRPCVFRLLDIGADKPLLFEQLTGNSPSHENPALGLRGIRLLLTWPQVLKTQLRALLRASRHGAISIMVPMVSSEIEMEAVRKLLQRFAIDLEITTLPLLGCMIEVPAAVMIADKLSQVSDFFSIGSNDLIQYTMAADRNNEACKAYYTADNPAIKKMIALTIQAAKNAAIPVSICGELASNSAWTKFFLNMGVHTLSMTAEFILPIRSTLSRLNYESES
ncbi:MAG: phosphoenolpyruvate--protein phosphotransferase [Mariprofundaceae bacterium]|nr:phosphoenolpyruvate--protein phosphotransferase [Mariprofundaceae bacterium]